MLTPDPTPTPLALLQGAIARHTETLGVHQTWLTAMADMLDKHHLRMDELQRTIAHIDLTLTALKDLLERGRNGP